MHETVNSRLESIPEVQSAITSGESLFLAGSRAALAQLPKGNWVGGTIPYFMTKEGGLLSEDRIFVTRVKEFAIEAHTADYGPEELARLYTDAPEQGITFLILPFGAAVHTTFAQKASSFDGFLLKPVVGWIAGVRVDLIGKEQPAVFNGKTGAVFEDRGVALHVTLPANKLASLDIVNIFESDGGALLRFEERSFHVGKCLVDGKSVDFASYITDQKISTEFPLVGDYNGSSINVSIQAVDVAHGKVDLYAPVVPGVEYHFAKPVYDYSEAFAKAIAKSDACPDFACNCILNYLYGKLEGKKTGPITGPITFGEIAHVLLNQTMVRLYLHDIG